MRISGNFLDRILNNILPMGILLGLIAGAFSTDKTEGFITYTLLFTFITWLLDTFIIAHHLGLRLNKLILTDKILFNEKIVDPSQIIKINTVNIYPNSIIAKWTISTIEFVLDDQTVFKILAKPHSPLYFFKYFFSILISYCVDRWKYKTGRQRGYTPFSTYFNKEMTQTLSILFSEYPNLRYI
ncbi:MAG: hypothetical protein ABIP95_00650 [Pelobium sp.]